MRISAIAVCLAVGCTNTGALELDLELADRRGSPAHRDDDGLGRRDLAPSSAASRTRACSTARASPPAISRSAPEIEIDVLFHDVSNRLVGVGEAPQLVDIKGDQVTKLSIPVRRPFIYASSGTKLYSFDPTLDPRDAKFQGSLAGLSSPQIAVSVGGDRLVVASSTTLQIVDTATHMVTGGPITIPGTVHDAAPVPGSHRIAVAHSGGIAIVDLDSMAVANGAGPSVDRVTVGASTDGRVVAYGLVGRVAPPASPVDRVHRDLVAARRRRRHARGRDPDDAAAGGQ